MNYSLLIRPKAEAELKEAKDWYQRHRRGLGADFLLCVEESLTTGNPGHNDAAYSRT